LATPVINNVIRQGQLEADLFAVNATGQPDGFARVAMRTSDYRKIEASALEEMLLHNHPSGGTRVSNAMRWKAENQQ
jgi:STE24 endopeptidase